MRRQVFFGALLCVVGVLWWGTSVSEATTLKITPLRYDASLADGEKKKGFVDISNPSSLKTTVKLSVQAFRQTDNTGSLEFYDSEAVRAGVQLDATEVELGPREAIHLAFVLDGTRLPAGDVFAAILASTEPTGTAPAEQAVRVGALLILTNKTPSKHDASIEQLSVPLLQFGDGINFDFSVHNNAKLGEATGFSPDITVSAWPYVQEKVAGPLVFAGRSRSVEYVKPGNFLGVIRIKVGAGPSENSAYSFVVTGNWRFLLPILIISGILVAYLALRITHPKPVSK